MEYDEVDNVTGRYDALNKKIIAITYDALHNPLTTTDALSNTTTNEECRCQGDGVIDNIPPLALPNPLAAIKVNQLDR
jgi:RHS Repeat.